ncbi:MAG: class II aldolase/adducin family protein [Verrucomicrobiota bacterium]|nr:class II aldolase/adducin family protein [Verrucomicrobiota bacterium]
MPSFQSLRLEVWKANIGLPKAGLVTMHSGNASGVHRESGLMLIKPSGIDYDALRPEDLAVVRLADGSRPEASEVPDGIVAAMKPSVDTVHHRLLYLKDTALGGVIHTHSNYATAWAAVGQSIPCALTAIADEFGAEIPCTPYIDNEGENIANAIFQYRGRGPAILLGQHGVFTFDKTPGKAFKAAVMVEDVAKTLLLARSLGPIAAFPSAEIEKWWGRYHSTYGQ